MCFIAAVPVKWETGQSLGDSLKAKAKDDFDKVMNMETDTAKRDALKKEKELLDGTMKAWMENINAVYVAPLNQFARKMHSP